MSLKTKTRSGIAWATAERLVAQAVTFLVSVLLARLLPPNEFGLVAVVLIFVSLAEVFTNCGLSQALIQRKEVRRVDISTVFYFNVGMALLMVAILCISAPTIARFYGEPRLQGVLQWLSINVVIMAMGRVQIAMLTREMQFAKLFRITLPSLIFGGTIGVALALAGWNIWALVAHSVSNAVLQTILVWCFCNPAWRPGLEFSFPSLKSMGRFGAGVFGSGLINRGFLSSYGLIVGKMFSVTDLAFYNRGRRLQELPIKSLVSVQNRVLFPAFSRIHDDQPRTKAALRLGIPLLAFAVCPLMVLLCIVAKPLTIVLLTDQWLPAVVLLQVFCIRGILRPFNAVNMAVIKAKGRSKLLLVLETTKTSVAIAALIVTCQYGVLYIVWGQVFATFIMFLINIFFTQRHIGYRIWEQLSDISAYLVLALCSGGITWTLGTFDGIGNLGLLSVQSLVFCAIYLGSAHVLNLPAYVTVGAAVPRQGHAFVQRLSRSLSL